MAVNPRQLTKSSSIDTSGSLRRSADAPTGDLEPRREACRRNLPPRLPLKYKPSQHYHRELFEQGFAQTADPWSVYVKLSQTHQAGPAYTACHSLTPFPVRVVKEVKLPGVTIPHRVVRPSHPNVVSLVEIFIREKSLYMVYENMEVSLAQIPAESWRETVDADVAFVCREVLQGLIYIRFNLRLSYGRFGPDDILLSTSGQVKLANIGEAFLQPIGEEKEESRSLGFLMVFMMEPDTALEHPETIVLRSPTRWPKTTLNFLKLTGEKDSNLQKLGRDGFIPRTLDSVCERKSDFTVARKES